MWVWVCTCSTAPCAHVRYVAPLISDRVVFFHCTETLTGCSIITSYCIQLTCRRRDTHNQNFSFSLKWRMMQPRSLSHTTQHIPHHTTPHHTTPYHQPPLHPHCCVWCSWRQHTSTRWFYNCRLQLLTNLKERKEQKGKPIRERHE